MNRLEELLFEYENYLKYSRSYLTDQARQNQLNLVSRQIADHLIKIKSINLNLIKSIKDK